MGKLFEVRKKLKILVILLLFCVVVLFQQYSFEKQKKVFEILEDNPLFVLNGEKLKKITFGYDNFVTDLVWLKTVQYIGGNARSSDYPLLYEYLKNVTDLDNKFYMPYFIAQLLLPEIGQAEKAVELSQKGLEHLPEKWEIPYYLGFIYYYYLDDYEQGSLMYQKASVLPGVLASAKRTAIHLQSKSNKHKIALEMWIEAYEDEKNPDVQEIISKQILREKNFLDLEKAVKQYFYVHNVYPQDLEDLVKENLIEEIPQDPISEWQKYQIQDKTIVLQ